MADHKLADNVCDVTELVLSKHGSLPREALHKSLVHLHIISSDQIGFETLSEYLRSDTRFASCINEFGQCVWRLSREPA